MQIKENTSTLKSFGVKKIITGCPHCFHTLKNEYPDFDYKAEVVHHTEFIKQLIENKKITLKDTDKESQSITYHDSCYLGRHNNIYDAPRTILAETTKDTREMPRSKNKGFCCGAGGGLWWKKETQGKTHLVRAQQVVDADVDTVVTGCNFCFGMMNFVTVLLGLVL